MGLPALWPVPALSRVKGPWGGARSAGRAPCSLKMGGLERERGDVGENMQQLKQYSQQRNIQIHACTTQTWLTENMTDSELWMNSKNTFSYTALKHANTNVPSTVICMYITVSRAKRNVFCKHAQTMERTGETASSALRRWDVF